MVLNYIWIAFFIIAFAVALCRTFVSGDMEIWSLLMNAAFDGAKNGFEISLGLTGVLTMWLGLMKVGENAGLISLFSRAASPLFSRLFPDIPKGHPALGSMFMNFSANMLGLDNAATPLGLKAMSELQQLNKDKDTASNSMIMFLVINASGLTLVPVGVMTIRAQFGAANPSDVFIPILLATFVATFVAVVALCIKQRIKIDRVLVSFAVGFVVVIGGIMYFFSQLPQDKMQLYSTFAANLLLFTIIVLFVGAGLLKRINVYESFIEGAKEGFKTTVTIIPYMIAILVGVGVFRASGAMDYIVDAARWVVVACGLDASFVEALPTALMKPLSGSASRALMIDCISTSGGVDTFVSRVAATIQGSTDTTFYILAVYFGSVGIRKTRYAVGYALLADLVGAVSGILIAYLFFFS